METSSLFITPKRKTRSSNTSSSSAENLPGEKRWKQSYSLACVFDKSNGDDEILPVLDLTEGVTEKLDLILLNLTNRDSRMEELNLIVNGTYRIRYPIWRHNLLLSKTNKKLSTGNFHTWKRILYSWTNKSKSFGRRFRPTQTRERMKLANAANKSFTSRRTADGRT